MSPYFLYCQLVWLCYLVVARIDNPKRISQAIKQMLMVASSCFVHGHHTESSAPSLAHLGQAIMPAENLERMANQEYELLFDVEQIVLLNLVHQLKILLLPLRTFTGQRTA